MPQVIKTEVSQTFWYDPLLERKDNEFTRASISIMHNIHDKPEQISWLDKLFSGGIFIPKKPSRSQTRALSILIKGPPGSGKTTLAMEICYRLSKEAKIDEDPIHSLYITSESDEHWLKQKAKSFNWPNADNLFVGYQPTRPQTPLITVWQTKDFKEYLLKPNMVPQSFMRLIVRNIAELFRIGSDIPKRIFEEFDQFRLENEIKYKCPHLLVIDSLNTVETIERSEVFQKFIALATCGPRIIILIIDSERSDINQYWEFICDNVIKLNRDYRSDYMIRTIEIIKARYQQHIWGKHQLKIYAPLSTKGLSKGDLRRAHPYRKEGGIFIFPSIHYYLSSYKRRTQSTVPEFDKTHLLNLNQILHGGFYKVDDATLYDVKQRIKDKELLELLCAIKDEPEKSEEDFLRIFKDKLTDGIIENYKEDLLKISSNGGFPRGRCTGFIGCRGGHKSHLGYLQILSRIIKYKNEKGLIISLRDDEGMARKTMSKIIDQEFRNLDYGLSELENDDKLEIIYYPPGYITPEEFFHRMFLSIHRMKHSSSHNNEAVRISLLFNSLDQLSSRFPLCAKEEIFVPGIIETLSAEDITSFFIAVEEPGQPEEQYGLLSMADVIINFSHKYFEKKDYCGHLNENLLHKKRLAQDKLEEIERCLGELHPTIVLQIIRFAGGLAAGAGGILELIDEQSPAFNIYKKYDSAKNEGLYFTAFSPKHPQGKYIMD